MTYDRWNPPTRTITVEHDRPVFVPPENPYGQGARVVDHPAGFKVRTRGVGGEVAHEYACPVHGRLTRMVPREAVPDEVACGQDACGRPATWCGSSCGIGHAAGEVMS